LAATLELIKYRSSIIWHSLPPTQGYSIGFRTDVEDGQALMEGTGRTWMRSKKLSGLDMNMGLTLKYIG